MKIARKLRHAAVAFVPFAALAVFACSPTLTLEDVLVRPTTMAAVGATSITAAAGAVVTNPVSVLVKDQGGLALANQSVTFTFSRGTPASVSVSTNASGNAGPATWTAPTAAGPATITASVPGFPEVANVAFTVTVNPAAPAAQTVAPPGSSNNQSAVAGTAVAAPPSVLVADQFGNGISGVVVTFTIQTGGGTLNGASATTATATTAANGLATLTSWILGPTVGSNTVRATTTVLPAAPVTFTATGTVGAVSTIVIAPPGNSQGQTAQAGSNVPNAPSVRVADANNNAISGVTARFTVGAGTGKILANAGDATGANTMDVVTNASGIATVFAWRLGAIGSNTLIVNIPSVGANPQFTITATGTAGAPASIAVVTETPSSNNQTAVVGAAVAVAPGAVVRDANGFGVAGQSVTFTVGASSGTIKATAGGAANTTLNVTTDANGVARIFSWTLGNRGANTLTAALTSTPAITTTFTATGTAGPPASIAIENVNQQGQTTVANTAVANAPAVVVRDANNLTVDAGSDITFRITAGGGAVSATGCTGTATSVSVTTDANGIARLGCWKPGTVGAGNSLRAEVTATTAIFVAFNATGTVGPPTQITFTNGPWQFTRITAQNGGIPKVTVRDANGNGVSGLTVNWSNAGNANSTVGGTTSSTTDALGVAQFQGTQGGIWTAANVASGSSMTLQATVAATALTASTTSIVVTNPNSITALISPSATTTVNTNVAPTPVVGVLDASGRPVPGTALTWSYPVNPGSNGAIVGANASTDSVGRATPGVWRVSQTAGTNTVQATVTATAITISLTTTGVAGTASQIAINGGNTQTAAAGTAVTTPPSVLVRDQFNNVVSGASVTFSPTTGSGSVTGSPATTNAGGIATVGSWTLGAAAGTHQLQALLTATPAVITTFSATATSTDPCSSPVAHTVGGSPVTGSLAATDCNFVSGTQTFYLDLFRITVPASTTRSMSATVNTPAINGAIRSFLYGTAGHFISISGAVGPVTRYYVLGPGTYDLGVTSENPTTTGSYTFSTALDPSIPTGCGGFLVTKNITVTTHTLSSTGGCLYTYQGGTSQVSSRTYFFFLPANQTATFRMSGPAIDWYLEAWDFTSGTRVLVTAADDGASGTTEVMTIPTATTGRYFEIRATHWNGQAPQSGTYTLIIDP